MCFSICCQNLQETALKNESPFAEGRAPASPSCVHPQAPLSGWMCCALSQGWAGRGEVAGEHGQVLPSHPTHLASSALGKNKGADLLGCAGVTLQGWRNVDHVSNQTYQFGPVFHDAQKSGVITGSGKSGLMATVFQTNRAVPELLHELLLVWGFFGFVLFCVGLCLRRVGWRDILVLCVCCIDGACL